MPKTSLFRMEAWGDLVGIWAGWRVAQTQRDERRRRVYPPPLRILSADSGLSTSPKQAHPLWRARPAPA